MVTTTAMEIRHPETESVDKLKKVFLLLQFKIDKCCMFTKTCNISCLVVGFLWSTSELAAAPFPSAII